MRGRAASGLKYKDLVAIYDRMTKVLTPLAKDGNKATAADRKSIFKPRADKMISGPPAAK